MELWSLGESAELTSWQDDKTGGGEDLPIEVLCRVSSNVSQVRLWLCQGIGICMNKTTKKYALENGVIHRGCEVVS